MALRLRDSNAFSCSITALYLLLLIFQTFNTQSRVLGKRSGDNSTNKVKDNYVPTCDIEDWKIENNTETVVLWTTDSWHCNLLVTSENGSRIALRILEYSHEDTPQYLYVERESNSGSSCKHKFLVFPNKFSSSCVTLFEHASLRFHIVANLTLQIKTFYNDKVSASSCPEHEKPIRCMESAICPQHDYFCNNISAVDHVTSCEFSPSFSNDEYEYPDLEGTSCNVQCPRTCECSLHSRELRAKCGENSKWTSLIVYPVDTTVLYHAHNRFEKIEANAFSSLGKLARLFLHDTGVKLVQKDAFLGLNELRLLTLSHNNGMVIKSGTFYGLHNLVEVYLRNNTFTELHPSVFKGLDNVYYMFLDGNNFHTLDAAGIHDLNTLRVLDLSNNYLQELPSDFCHLFPNIFYVNLANNSLQKLSARSFQECKSLETLNLNGNDLKWISKDTFVGIRNISKVLVDNFYTCCFVTNATCTPQNPRPEFLTCKRLLPHGILRVFMWILGICALFGNAMVIYWRCREKQDANKVQSLLITNLSLSDLLMGVYMLILTCADAYFREYFPSHADAWRSGSICKIAGLLAMLSSEASVFFLVLISIDRLIGVKYPFSTRRLTKKSTRIVATTLWVIALIISMIATLLSGTDYYDVSEVCIGLPLARKPLTEQQTRKVNISSSNEKQKIDVKVLENIGHKPGMYFSIAVFIGINFVCFVLIALCYTIIFVTFHESTKRSVRRQEREEEIKMAGKMAIIVVTDFLCWMPIVIMSIMVQTGAVILSPEMYAWTVTFILPINSSVNPFLYTISTVVSSRLALRKTRKYSNPTMETQHD